MRHPLTATALALCLAAAPALAQDGGTMTVTYKDDVSTLDPAVGYDWQNRSMIKSPFNGPMDYQPGTTDLAEDHTVSEDGLTYASTLRDGVTFHNGRTLTAEGIKFSIERVVRPETPSPGQGFVTAIEGFDAVAIGDG